MKGFIEEGGFDREEDVVCIITRAGFLDLSTARKLISKKMRVKMRGYSAEGKVLTTKLGDTKMRFLSILAYGKLYG